MLTTLLNHVSSIVLLQLGHNKPNYIVSINVPSTLTIKSKAASEDVSKYAFLTLMLIQPIELAYLLPLVHHLLSLTTEMIALDYVSKV